jgi:hypothetical protein
MKYMELFWIKESSAVLRFYGSTSSEFIIQCSPDGSGQALFSVV